MMEAINLSAFFTRVLEFFNLIWDVITKLVDSLFTLFEIIQTTSQLPGQILAIGLPTVIVTSLTAVAAITLAKLVVGR